MTLTLGFSPCPNDTFIFDALVNKKIDTGGLDFEVLMEDVQTLNTWAIESKLDITKLSYAVLPLVVKDYSLLDSGSALGSGVGPLLIANKNRQHDTVEEQLIAIPGEHTTAHMLFSMAFPGAKQKVFLRYDEIESFVSEGKGLGVIIHENRFTYASKGLVKIIDLGDFWERETGMAIPLGGIVVRRNIDLAVALQVEHLIRKSIESAFAEYPRLSAYVKEHALEMSEDVMRQHIELYVNDHSLSLGIDGRKAVKKMMAVYRQVNQEAHSEQSLFLSGDQ